MLVVLDTNVILSAFLWFGKLSNLIPLVENSQITLAFSKETLGELKKVLKRPKFKTRLDKVNLTIPEILNVLKSRGRKFTLPKIDTSFVKEDPSDDKFLLLAKAANTKYLISGDKRLLKLKKFKNTKIISVSEFLNLFS